MDTLSIEQLHSVPWHRNFLERENIPAEPDPEQIAELFRVPFEKRDSRYALFYCWAETVRAVGPERKRILDASCGRGQVARILNLLGHAVQACDIFDCFKATDVHFKQIDLNRKLPYADHSFDVVINCEGLQYLDHSDNFIQESARILSDEGRLILSVPNIQSLAGRVSFLRTGKLFGYDADVMGRKNLIHLPYLQELLVRNGFKIVNISGNVPLTSFRLKLLERLVRNNGTDSVLNHAHSLIITTELSRT